MLALKKLRHFFERSEAVGYSPVTGPKRTVHRLWRETGKRKEMKGVCAERQSVLIEPVR